MADNDITKEYVQEKQTCLDEVIAQAGADDMAQLWQEIRAVDKGEILVEALQEGGLGEGAADNNPLRTTKEAIFGRGPLTPEEP